MHHINIALRFPLLVFLAACTSPSSAQNKNARQQPNIIIFLVDDMGWMDTSMPFGNAVGKLNQQFRTPNMQRMAQEGMVFTNAYANPVCTPTRAALLTGASAARTHITNWTNISANQPVDYPDSVLQTPAWNLNGLSPLPFEGSFVAKPLPQLLKEAGYVSLHVGKAHWGGNGSPGSDPLNLGFTSHVGGAASGHPQSYYGEKNFGNERNKITPWAVPGLQEFYGQDIFLTEALTRKALQLMETPIAQKRPFFLYLGHYAVHTPIQPDKRFFDRYLQAGLDSTEAAYASLIEGMDKSLGDIMDFLKATNVEKNTILVFMSDNGGLSNAGRGGKRNTHNAPLRAGKGSMYEGGIRIPMMVKWTGLTTPGSRAHQYVMVEDFFSTVLDITGIKPKASHFIDGKSYLSLLKNPALGDTTRALVFHYPHRWTAQEDEAISWASAIRQGHWKLVYRMKQQKLELYDLSRDIGETNDLSNVYPFETMRLAKLLGNELRHRGAQMPTWKQTGKPVAWPDGLSQ
jgi:arylsulfatase A-like enzyme